MKISMDIWGANRCKDWTFRGFVKEKTSEITTGLN
jgi:hypothetical protein